MSKKNAKRKKDEAESESDDESKGFCRILCVRREVVVKNQGQPLDTYEAIWTEDHLKTFPAVKQSYIPKTVFEEELLKDERPIFVHPYVLEEFREKKRLQAELVESKSSIEALQKENEHFKTLVQGGKKEIQEYMDKIHALTEENKRLKLESEKTDKDTPQKLKTLTEERNKLKTDFAAAQMDRKELGALVNVRDQQIQELKQAAASMAAKLDASNMLITTFQHIITPENTIVFRNMAELNNQIASMFQSTMPLVIQKPSPAPEPVQQTQSVMNGSLTSILDPDSMIQWPLTSAQEDVM